jgi:hypothetical protein
MDILSAGCYVAGCFVLPDVLSRRTFFPMDVLYVLSVRTFCLAGRFVPPDVLSTDVLSPDVFVSGRFVWAPSIYFWVKLGYYL